MLQLQLSYASRPRLSRHRGARAGHGRGRERPARHRGAFGHMTSVLIKQPIFSEPIFSELHDKRGKRVILRCAWARWRG